MIRFFHCADLHLGKALSIKSRLTHEQQNQFKEAAYESLNRLIEDAIRVSVDFIVIAGDVFDDEVRSLKGQWALSKAFERLGEYGIEVYMSHGNHDPHVSDTAFTYPDNVHLFGPSGDTFTYESKEGERVRLSGFSYPERAFSRRAVSMFPERSPDTDWQIGVLHGQETGVKDHAPYAPFTVSELLPLGYDYWALGHIHKRMTLSSQPPVIYPGSMQGTNRKESGDKGYLDVRLAGSEVLSQFIAAAPVTYRSIEMDVTGMEEWDEVLRLFQEQVPEVRQGEQIIADISFHGFTPLYSDLHVRHGDGELRELLKNGADLDDEWVIDHLSLSGLYDADLALRQEEDPFLADLHAMKEELLHEEIPDQYLTQLKQNRRLQAYLTKQAELPDKEELIGQALDYILTAVVKKEAERR